MPRDDFMPTPDGDFDQWFLNLNIELPGVAATTGIAAFTDCQRLGIVEQVFANLRARQGMNRFTLQWRLYCHVHNIEKLAKSGGGWNWTARRC